jgi:hypothetical protein
MGLWSETTINRIIYQKFNQCISHIVMVGRTYSRRHWARDVRRDAERAERAVTEQGVTLGAIMCRG